MAPISASEIPSLNLLYKVNKLGSSRLPLIGGATSAHNDRIGLFRGDLTKLAVDAIVNAANTSLLGGGGVDGAIHRGAGPRLVEECATLGGCSTGSAKITDAYELPCKKVIHAVGPVYEDIHPFRSETSLQGCYRTALELAVQNGLSTIAFAGISTGIYGYPSMDAAIVACGTVKAFLDTEDGKKIDKVIFVTFEEKDVRAYNTILPRFFPPAGEDPAQEAKSAQQEAEAEAKAGQLPSVPTTDPADPERVLKKQKQEGGSD